MNSQALLSTRYSWLYLLDDCKWPIFKHLFYLAILPVWWKRRRSSISLRKCKIRWQNEYCIIHALCLISHCAAVLPFQLGIVISCILLIWFVTFSNRKLYNSMILNTFVAQSRLYVWNMLVKNDMNLIVCRIWPMNFSPGTVLHYGWPVSLHSDIGYDSKVQRRTWDFL